jgi:hypothetical protein
MIGLFDLRGMLAMQASSQPDVRLAGETDDPQTVRALDMWVEEAGPLGLEEYLRDRGCSMGWMQERMKFWNTSLRRDGLERVIRQIDPEIRLGIATLKDLEVLESGELEQFLELARKGKLP